ncbi:MAG: alkaline phosphatase family protein [Acidobacteria bacterium]|nr:alkaline phosphatase family protein [Acidobacteriota bacterium]
MHGFRRFLAVLAGAALVAAAGVPQSVPAGAKAAQRVWRTPKLVVVLVVDQMRGDYIERYGRQWTKGLRRLVEQGAWFRQAAYPYMNTVTCAGHATIGTGTFPMTHGMVQNLWWDREAGKQVTCTEDAVVKAISYGSPDAKAGHSPQRLQVPTLADELRLQGTGQARVVTLSIKPRSAVMLAGHDGTAVTWFEEQHGAWTTSSAFASGPVPAVEKFVKANPVDRDLGKTWTRALPEPAYLFADDAEGEKPPESWTKAFPHALKGRNGRADALYYTLWAQSPYSDVYLGQMAQAVADELELGRRNATDFLGVSFSALDMSGHEFGPKSHEVQDILARLDRTIGALLDHLDRTVGAENYVVGFSADHGVAPIPEQVWQEGISAGRVVTQEVEGQIEKAMTDLYGPGKYVAQMNYPEVYFAPGIYAKLQADATGMRKVVEAIQAVAGVWRVFRSEEMAAALNSRDATVRAVGLSFYAGRSGDMVVVPKAYWFFVNASKEIPPGPATTHGTSHGYDTRVPMILMGHGIRRGEYLETASPADIAPTLGFLCGITMARADGRVLTEALELPRAAEEKSAERAVAAKKH